MLLLGREGYLTRERHFLRASGGARLHFITLTQQFNQLCQPVWSTKQGEFKVAASGFSEAGGATERQGQKLTISFT